MILFATNRVLNEGPTPKDMTFPRKVSFDLDNNQSEQSIYFCRRNTKEDYQEIGHKVFFDTLEDADIDEILFYIHGFSNLPEPTIFERVKELQKHFTNISPRKVLVVPLIWPCDNDAGILKDYFDDQMAADASDLAFMRFFEWFFDWLKEKRGTSATSVTFNKNMNILAHSMGARVLQGALNKAVQYFQLMGFPLLFRNIFLSAADIVNEALEPSEIGKWISPSTRNVIVYYASDDWALRSSQAVNLGNFVASRRLGQRGPEDFNKIPKNIFAFDCGDFNNRYDTIIGHGYFASEPGGSPGLVLRHMLKTMNNGRVAITAGERDIILDEDVLK